LLSRVLIEIYEDDPPDKRARRAASAESLHIRYRRVVGSTAYF
jgi:hypothetical protein